MLCNGKHVFVFVCFYVPITVCVFHYVTRFIVYTENTVGATCGRLLVHVQKGKRFIHCGKINIIVVFIPVHTFARAWLLLTIVQGHEISGAISKNFGKLKGILDDFA